MTGAFFVVGSDESQSFYPISICVCLFFSLLRMSSGVLKRHCAWLAAASRFTVYWFLWRSQICQFRQWSDKKNFASKWNNFTTGNSQQRDGRNQVGFLPLSLTRPEWQTQTTVRSWRNIRPWSFTGEQWNKQAERESENGWICFWHHKNWKISTYENNT